MGILNRRGQSMIEYSMLVVIILGALIAMSHYFKRGVQGRWKSAVDEMGDQYDPRFGDTDFVSRVNSNTETYIFVVEDAAKKGYWTNRQDTVESVETKTGYMRTGAY